MLAIEVDLRIGPRILIIPSVLLVVLIIRLVVAFIERVIDLPLWNESRGDFCSYLRRVMLVRRNTTVSNLFLLKIQLIALCYQISLGISFTHVLLLQYSLRLVLPRQRLRFELLEIEDLLH